MTYLATFIICGNPVTALIDDVNAKFMGVVEIKQDVPDWVGKIRTTIPALTPKGAKIRANGRRSGAYMDQDTYKVIDINDYEIYVVEASNIVPAPLYSGVVEHNTWEGESWFHAFPQTEKVDQALKELEALYNDHQVVCSAFEHRNSNIGHVPNAYTFRFGIPHREWEVMPNLYSVRHTLSGRPLRRKKGLGGGYMGGWQEYVSTESDALEAIKRAIADAKDGHSIYKGHPLKVNPQEFAQGDI